MCVRLEGQAAVNGTEHNLFYRELESFWDQFRRFGARSFQRPTCAEYDRALKAALRRARFAEEEAGAIAEIARMERLDNNLLDEHFVP